MSVAKLLLSGLLVASGLILGAFTLHGHFAPQWEVQATAPAARNKALSPADPIHEKSRGVPGGIAPDSWAPQLVKAEAPDPAAADAEAKARKRLAEKKLAEKRLAQKKDKAEPEEEPQTVFSWLSSLLADNSK
jgi:hypothetical protein